MWIELTDCFGQPITLNSRHIVALKTCGEKTLVEHISGETLVMESHARIRAALQLEAMDRPARPATELSNYH